MHILRFGSASLVAAALSGCAAAPAATPDPGSQPVPSQTVGVAVSRWTGVFNPKQGYTGTVVTTTRQKAYGNVELLISPDRPNVTRVRLSVSVPVEPGLTNLGWAVHPGGCGSGAPPLMAPGTFPSMVLGSNGRAALDDDIGFTLPGTGSYHVNVFRGAGMQLSDVITCASLRRS